jgi:hypothetical protein
VQIYQSLPEYIRRTKFLPDATLRVRDALKAATEPDELIFRQLPAALGLAEVPARGSLGRDSIRKIVEGLSRTADNLQAAYPALLAEVGRAVADATSTPPERVRRNLAERASVLDGVVTEPRVRAFVSAVTTDFDEDEAWFEYLAMTVTGLPPASWSDDERLRFFANVKEIGGTFRRLEALYRDHAALDVRGFDAVRVTLTLPDGGEDAKVVWLDKAHRNAVSEVMQESVERV